MKKRKIAFIFLVALSLIKPYPNMVDASVGERALNVQKTFFGDDVFARKEGKTCKKVTEAYGVVHTVKDTFVEEKKSGEEHVREDTLEIELDEVSNDKKISKAIKQKFGLDVVYAGNEELKMTKKGSDSSGTVRITLTVNYTISTYKNLEYANISKASGTISATSGSPTRFGNGVSVQSNEYTVGQYGFTKTSGYKSFIKEGLGGCSVGSKWTYKPIHWSSICSEHSCHMGANQTITLKRGKSKWKFTVTNNYR